MSQQLSHSYCRVRDRVKILRNICGHSKKMKLELIYTYL